LQLAGACGDRGEACSLQLLCGGNVGEFALLANVCALRDNTHFTTPRSSSPDGRWYRRRARPPRARLHGVKWIVLGSQVDMLVLQMVFSASYQVISCK
jgi:hypothetical protein